MRKSAERQRIAIFLCRSQAITGGSGGMGGLGNGRGGGCGGSGSGLGPGPGSGRWNTHRFGELETVDLIPKSLRAYIDAMPLPHEFLKPLQVLLDTMAGR